MGKAIHLRVNDEEYDIEVENQQTLLDVIRERLDMTGTKRGCETGDCGACTVIMNGKAVNSCLVLAVEADGAEVQTIEGLAKVGELHHLQEAFVQYGAVQCGFCTPGMIMSAKALLDENNNPTEEEIRRAIAGNLCRCTGYTKIVNAIKATSEKSKP